MRDPTQDEMPGDDMTGSAETAAPGGQSSAQKDASNAPANADFGMGMQAFSAAFNAYAQWSSGQVNNAILKHKAEFARTQAAWSMEAGEYKAGLLDIHANRLAGAQASSYASQGVVAGAGSAASVVDSSAAATAQDEAMIRLNARRVAYGLEVSASNDDFNARMARRSANMGAAGSLIGGATNILGSGGGGAISTIGSLFA